MSTEVDQAPVEAPPAPPAPPEERWPELAAVRIAATAARDMTVVRDKAITTAKEHGAPYTTIATFAEMSDVAVRAIHRRGPGSRASRKGADGAEG
jgi:hypothetical protein